MLAVKPWGYATGLRRSCLYAFTLNGLSLEVPRCRLRTVWWQLLFDGDMPDEHPQISSETDDRGLLGGGSYPRWLISIHTWSQLRITRRWIERRLAHWTAYHPHNRFESHYAASGTIWNHALNDARNDDKCWLMEGNSTGAYGFPVIFICTQWQHEQKEHEWIEEGRTPIRVQVNIIMGRHHVRYWTPSMRVP